MYSAVNRRGAVLRLRYGYCGSGGAHIAGCVSNSEGNRVNTTIPAAISLGSELHRLTVGGDDDIVQSIPVSVAILDLVARNTRDHYAAGDISITVRDRTANKVGDVERLVLMVWWPH